MRGLMLGGWGCQAGRGGLWGLFSPAPGGPAHRLGLEAALLLTSSASSGLSSSPSSPPWLQSSDLKMQDVCVALFLMVASAPILLATSGAEPERDPFKYDYESLKIAGLIVAGVLCAMGIIILLSGKCRCKFNKKKEHRSRSQDPQLITPGSASHC